VSDSGCDIHELPSLATYPVWLHMWSMRILPVQSTLRPYPTAGSLLTMHRYTPGFELCGTNGTVIFSGHTFNINSVLNTTTLLNCDVLLRGNYPPRPISHSGALIPTPSFCQIRSAPGYLEELTSPYAERMAGTMATARPGIRRIVTAPMSRDDLSASQFSIRQIC
jgi:hypothetical protein